MATLEELFDKYTKGDTLSAKAFRDREERIREEIPSLLERAATDAVLSCVVNHHRQREADRSYRPTLNEFMLGMVDSSDFSRVQAHLEKGGSSKFYYSIDGLKFKDKNRTILARYAPPVRHVLELIKMARLFGVEAVLENSKAVLGGLKNYCLYKGNIHRPKTAYLQQLRRQDPEIEPPKIKSPLREVSTDCPIDLIKPALELIAPDLLDYKGEGELVLFSGDSIMILRRNLSVAAVHYYSKKGEEWMKSALSLDKPPRISPILNRDLESFMIDLNSEAVRAFSELLDEEIADSEIFARRMHEKYQIRIETGRPHLNAVQVAPEFTMEDLVLLDAFLKDASLLHGVIKEVRPGITNAKNWKFTDEELYEYLCHRRLLYTINAAFGRARDPVHDMILLRTLKGDEDPRVLIDKKALHGLRTRFRLTSEVLFLQFADSLFISMGIEKYNRFRELWWEDISKPANEWRERTGERSDEVNHSLTLAIFISTIVKLQEAANGGDKVPMRKVQREFLEGLLKKDLSPYVRSPNSAES